MKHPGRVGLLLLALGACRIEQTPASYIDNLETPQEEIQSSEAELTDRLRSIAAALGRDDVRSIQLALAPAAESYGIGPGADPIQGGELGSALAAAAGGQAVTVDSITVRVAPENTFAWFRVAYRSMDAASPDPNVRFSGVFTRQEGEWRLVQGHVSTSITEPADSVRPDRPEGAG